MTINGKEPRLTDLIEERIEKLRKKMQDNSLDVLWVTHPENRQYLSGFTGEDGGPGESAGSVFISMDHLILATDSRYVTQARNQAPLYEVFLHTDKLSIALPGILGEMDAKNLGFEEIFTPFSLYSATKKALSKAGMDLVLTPTRDLVEDLRQIKSQDEIQALRAASILGETAFSEFTAGVKPGITEKQAAWDLEKQLREKGAQALSFPVIAAFGPNSALPHAQPTDRVLSHADPMLVDWGCRLNGYCSDATRTRVPQQAEDELKKIFQVVKQAHEAAVAMIRPGKTAKEVDAAARSIIEAAGYGKYFGHGLGHGVGLAVHEPPRISPKSDAVLAPGMVFTVEPGIYLPKKGGVRLENMVRVTRDGVEVFNRLPF